jgi:hypothetical protein
MSNSKLDATQQPLREGRGNSRAFFISAWLPRTPQAKRYLTFGATMHKRSKQPILKEENKYGL